MAQYRSYQTPLKEEQENVSIPMTSDLTPEHGMVGPDYKVDYKVKTFKLMKQLAESQMANKKGQNQIRHLQREIQAFKKQIEKIFNMLGAHNFEQAYKKVEFISQTDKKLGNEDKLNEWANIIQEYKKIINAQQYKYIKLQQQFKISQVKLKRYEQDKFPAVRQKAQKVQRVQKTEKVQKGDEYIKQQSHVSQDIKQLKDKNLALQKSVQSLDQEVSILKKEYKQAIIERDHIKDLFDQLQNKYNLQIQHFEEMEKHVEERLIEVQRQMNYYRQQREQHLEKIELMKKEIDYRQSETYYSFGGTKHVEIQTQQVEQMPQFNNQCLQISIKTLLQQNERLKNTLITLYSNRTSQNLPKEIELQLKILVNMKQNIRKNQQRQKTKSSILQEQQMKEKQIQSQMRQKLEAQHTKVPEMILQQDEDQESSLKQQSSSEII